MIDRLTNDELEEWGLNLGMTHGDIEGLDAKIILHLMQETAGTYEGEFDIEDAERMLEIFEEAEDDR